MRKKFLIVAGLPKSGTTFIYDQALQNSDFFNMPAGAKEIDFFRRGEDFDHYLNCFASHDDRVYLDSSPLYVDDIFKTSDRIAKCLAGHDVKILLCLRDPLERAFSHYLHDVAQNQKLLGHADYNFFMPSVISKYLYPLEKRVQQLQKTFGAENVFGFSFAASNTRFEKALIEFADLPKDWTFNLSKNPAPGFTSPTAYYNGDHPSTINLGGDLYHLPKGHLLIVNRQFSIYQPRILPAIADTIMQRQNSITRVFDSGLLSETTRNTILDDYCRAAEMLGLDLQPLEHPRVFRSKTSETLPPHIQNKLKKTGSVEQTVQALFDGPIASPSQMIVAQAENTPSLATYLARMDLANNRDPSETRSLPHLTEDVLKLFGPVHMFAQRKLARLVSQKRYDEALDFFAQYGTADTLLFPIDVANHLRARKLSLPEDVEKKMIAMGIRTRLPEDC